VVAVLAAVLQVAVPAGAEEHGTIEVVPTCIAPGTPSGIVVLGRSWTTKPVQLSMTTGGVTKPLGSANPRVSPVTQQAGSFSFLATVTGTAPILEVTAVQGNVTSTAAMLVQGGCVLQVSAKPPCLGGPGTALVSGTGFKPNAGVPIDVDLFGDAEAPSLWVKTNAAGAFSAGVALPAPKGPIPIIASNLVGGEGTLIVTTAVVFVAPCPPPGVSTTSTSQPAAIATTTTTAGPGSTTTVAVGKAPPPGVPPDLPPGTPARVSISPRTVRPGRCAVVTISDAPPALPVMARFADGPPVGSQTGPDGRSVVSVCVPHDSGGRIGPVGVVLAIGPFGPTPVFTVLRVPSRPQPPLLQAGADSRRS